jgi:hypothetical protein
MLDDLLPDIRKTGSGKMIEKLFLRHFQGAIIIAPVFTTWASLKKWDSPSKRV